jgi:chromosome segregation ATPase
LEIAREKSQDYKERIVYLTNEFATANTKVQTLLSELETAKANLQLKDAEIQNAIEQLEGVNNQVLANSQSPDPGVDKYLEEIRKKDIKLRGLLEENDTLIKKANEATDEHTSIVGTLGRVLGHINEVLNLKPRRVIQAPLQDVVSIIQGRLGMGSGAKRARDGGNGIEEGRPEKRARAEDAIEVD